MPASASASVMARLEPSPRRVRPGIVKCIGGKPVPASLGIDSSAPFFGMAQFFEHQHSGAFGQHESVTVPVKRPACFFRFVVPRRKRPCLAETGKDQRGERSFRTSRDHDIGVSALDDLHGFAHGVRSRCAGGRNIEAGAPWRRASWKYNRKPCSRATWA